MNETQPHLLWMYNDEKEFIDGYYDQPKILLVWLITSYLRKWDISDEDIYSLRERAKELLKRSGVIVERKGEENIVEDRNGVLERMNSVDL